MTQLLCLAAQAYVFVLFGRIILSWFPVSPGTPMASVFSVLYTLTEPVLGPLRRVLPPVGMGGMGLDLSPMIVSVAIQFFLVPVLCTL
ncbi:MAG: YggT family protein [Actinomycetota bacterium]|nr:YggT family protein [Actinomycetota bacterium]MDQ3681016.1 YggT family protein [Actinomycetota bacterium]